MHIVTIVLPVFGIIALGFGARWYRLVDDTWVSILNRFVYTVALPALIVVSFMRVQWNDVALLKVLGLNAAVLLLFCLLLFAVLASLPLSRKMKAALFVSAAVGNTIYMGFPIAGAFAGSAYTSTVAGVGSVQLALGIALCALAAEVFVVRSRDPLLYVRDFFKNPLVVSMIAGFVLSFVYIPGVMPLVNTTLGMVAATASPVALFALGGFLHGKFYRKHALLGLVPVLLKLVAFPLLVMIVGFTVGGGGMGYKISALLGAMPTAVTAFVVAEKFDLDRQFVANAIVVTTVLSLLTIPLMLAL